MKTHRSVLLSLFLLSACAEPGDPTVDGESAVEGESAADGDEDAFDELEINGGTPVRGAGAQQQWEGIVMTAGGRGLCSSAFITDRHLISASHCYAKDGPVSNMRVRAPSWNNGAYQSFPRATVKRSGPNQSLDVAIIDLGASVPWATPARRFVLHAGKPSTVNLHIYGYGSSSLSGGGAGTLRGAPNRATLRVNSTGRGVLRGIAGQAQLCTGDSGGPAFVENTAPVLYAINQAIIPGRSASGSRSCPGTDGTILLTSVSDYLPFVEKTIGKTCARKTVDGLQVAQCW